MVLLRLEDAIVELQGIEGMRVHRSWWVARSAVKNIVYDDGKMTLLLKSGTMIPVSRTHLKITREQFGKM
ncbi:MAG: LytTR family DNA-binding domain-containing protein [Ahrensia sp.]|nr:LytTR family DNA-binding domain-containing protein [Ahrensia sp.]